ncbi:hypothetical protein [uncultured Bacteroides sp.]|nr:hypothetical protein [uncultured Bacteroides sp.]
MFPGIILAINQEKTDKMILLYDYYDRVENTVLSGKNSRNFPKKED